MYLCWRTRMRRIQRFLASSALQGQLSHVFNVHTIYWYIEMNISTYISLLSIVLCSRAMRCVCTTWMMCEQRSMASLPTGRDQSTTGPPTKAGSPTHAPDLWVLFQQPPPQRQHLLTYQYTWLPLQTWWIRVQALHGGCNMIRSFMNLLKRCTSITANSIYPNHTISTIILNKVIFKQQNFTFSALPSLWQPPFADT